MATRGTKPTPTALKILRGNPGKRPLNENEPKPKKGRPRIPIAVAKDAIAKTCWQWLLAELEGMKLLTTADARTMEAYCICYAHWRKAIEFIAKNGFTYAIKSGPTTVKGKIQPGAVKSIAQFPEVSIANTNLGKMITLGGEMGLSPAARTRIKCAVEEAEASPLLAIQQKSRRGRKQRSG